MVSEDEVRKIAKLAHLEITGEEFKIFATQLSNIIEYVEQLKSIDISGIEPTSHVHGSTNVFREDEIGTCLNIDDLKKNAPECSGRFIKVPLIVE